MILFLLTVLLIVTEVSCYTHTTSFNNATQCSLNDKMLTENNTYYEMCLKHNQFCYNTNQHIQDLHTNFARLFQENITAFNSTTNVTLNFINITHTVLEKCEKIQRMIQNGTFTKRMYYVIDENCGFYTFHISRNWHWLRVVLFWFTLYFGLRNINKYN